MTAARRRRRVHRPLRPLAAAAVLLGGLVIGSAFASVTIQANALARTIAELHSEIAYEQAYSAQLQATAAEKRTTEYVVEKAKQLGCVWPWEALIAVQRDANARAAAMPVGERPSRLSRWFALFIRGN